MSADERLTGDSFVRRLLSAALSPSVPTFVHCNIPTMKRRAVFAVGRRAILRKVPRYIGTILYMGQHPFAGTKKE